MASEIISKDILFTDIMNVLEPSIKFPLAVRVILLVEQSPFVSFIVNKNPAGVLAGRLIIIGPPKVLLTKITESVNNAVLAVVLLEIVLVVLSIVTPVLALSKAACANVATLFNNVYAD